MTRKKDTISLVEVKEALAGDRDFLKGLIQPLLQEVLEGEMDEALGAAKYERTGGRSVPVRTLSGKAKAIFLIITGIQRAGWVVGKYAVLDDQRGHRCFRVPREQNVVPDAQPNNDIELRVFRSQERGLYRTRFLGQIFSLCGRPVNVELASRLIRAGEAVFLDEPLFVV